MIKMQNIFFKNYRSHLNSHTFLKPLAPFSRRITNFYHYNYFSNKYANYFQSNFVHKKHISFFQTFTQNKFLNKFRKINTQITALSAGIITSYIIYSNFSNFWFNSFSTNFSYKTVNADSRNTNTNLNVNRFCVKIANNDLHTVKQYLLNGFDPNTKHTNGQSPIHVASAIGNVKIVKLLIEYGADVNAVDESSLQKFRKELYENNRPTNGNRSVNIYRQVNMWVDQRAHCFPLFEPVADTCGFSPLHFAVITKNDELVALLLKNGANPLIRSENGEIAEEIIDQNDSSFDSIRKALKVESDKFLDRKRAMERKYRRLHPLEEQLKAKIVGQLTPIDSVASAIRRKQNGQADEDHPLVFLFLGSSGVGKTELAKQLANYLHPDKPEAFIRLDLSEFQSKHEVSKFIGSPPGYIGFEEGGQLTEKLRQNPDAVVLLDEVEKAHPDVLTIMLQLFDEGRITDGKGTTVHCKDAIFVMTSNLAQREIANSAETLRSFAKKQREIDSASKLVDCRKDGIENIKQANESDAINISVQDLNQNEDKENDQILTQSNEFDDLKTLESDETSNLAKRFVNNTIYPVLRSHFGRDEFLGRINETLFFLPFDNDELTQLVNIELERQSQKAQERHKILFEWSNDVVNLLKNGYNIHYGARSIKHEVERRVVNQLAKAHEDDLISEGTKVYAFVGEKNRKTISFRLNKSSDEDSDNDSSLSSSSQSRVKQMLTGKSSKKEVDDNEKEVDNI